MVDLLDLHYLKLEEGERDLYWPVERSFELSSGQLRGHIGKRKKAQHRMSKAHSRKPVYSVH